MELLSGSGFGRQAGRCHRVRLERHCRMTEPVLYAYDAASEIARPPPAPHGHLRAAEVRGFVEEVADNSILPMQLS